MSCDRRSLDSCAPWLKKALTIACTGPPSSGGCGRSETSRGQNVETASGGELVSPQQYGFSTRGSVLELVE